MNMPDDGLLSNIKCWKSSTAQVVGEGGMLVGEVHEPKVSCTSANLPKICSSTVICCTCV